MRVAGLVLRRHVLLDSLTWAAHRQQDEGVGENDEGAGQGVAKDEKTHDVGQGQQLVVGCVPVNAAGRAVRFGAVMPPLCQGSDSKHHWVTPHCNHQEAGVGRGELAAWSDEIQKVCSGCCEYYDCPLKRLEFPIWWITLSKLININYFWFAKVYYCYWISHYCFHNLVDNWLVGPV